MRIESSPADYADRLARLPVRGAMALAAGLMVEHETAHLVVVSPDTGRPVGMLSTLDVARAADRG